MVELSHWEDVIVPQRHETGCIPTGYEWTIRYSGIESVQLDTFQEVFDLDFLNEGSNNFVSIAEKIKSRYPQINIQIQSFNSGLEKIRAIRELMEADIPCLISLSLGEHIGWHIMPVLSVDDQRMKMIHHANERGNQLWDLTVEEVIWRHDTWVGGKDIAWIQPSHES